MNKINQYGIFVAVTEENPSKEIIAGCISELIKSIDTEKYIIHWDTLKTIIHKAKDLFDSPFDYIEIDETGIIKCWWTIGIKYMAEEKDEGRYPEEDRDHHPEE